MFDLVEPCCSEHAHERIAWREVRDAAWQIAVGGAIAQQGTDARYDSTEVDVVPPADDAPVRDADIQQSDSAAGPHDTSELDEEPFEIDEVAQGESTCRTVDGGIGEG